MDTDEAPGWDAIDAALAPLVGTVEPAHWGTGTMLPDQDGIWGVSAYALDDHWLYVTYGLSELFTKVSDDPAVSGWGEELTFRHMRGREETAPGWPASLLARLGELVYERAQPLEPGRRIELNDRDDERPPAIAFADDPQLEPITTPFGSLSFVTAVGVGDALLRRMRDLGTEAVLDAVRASNPLLVSGGPGLDW